MEAQNNTIVYTGGTFDVPHVGHVNFLRECAKLGKVLVALNTDEFVEKYKGQKPVFSFQERYDMLANLEYVKFCEPNIGNEDSRVTIMKANEELNSHQNGAKIKYLAIGSDWATKDYYKQMGFTQEWLDSQGITVVYIPYYNGISTSEIKKRYDLYAKNISTDTNNKTRVPRSNSKKPKKSK